MTQITVRLNPEVSPAGGLMDLYALLRLGCRGWGHLVMLALIVDYLQAWDVGVVRIGGLATVCRHFNAKQTCPIKIPCWERVSVVLRMPGCFLPTSL